MSIYYVPSINLLGRGCLKELKQPLLDLGKKKALVVTDKVLVKFGVVKKVTDILDEINLEYILFDEVKPNPTCKNVDDGLSLLKKEGCDFVITIGGGSPQDAGKAMAVLATNEGDMREYEGLHKSKNKSLDIVAISTTSGTSAEVTINYVITDEDRDVKMVMVDKNALSTITVNDPELMISKPAHLTAATGMDALTHAIETIVTPGANTVTLATALDAVKIIFDNLSDAVKDGNNIEAREQLCYAVFLTGISFSNGGLGNVHAMAHQLGGMYDLPHGVCNAMLLPYVEEENGKFVPDKFRLIAKVLGLNVESKDDKECVDFVISKIRELSKEVNIPNSLSELGVKDIDIDLLADNALKDACAPGNPVEFSKEKVIELFEKIK